jgi:hypothetical protein
MSAETPVFLEGSFMKRMRFDDVNGLYFHPLSRLSRKTGLLAYKEQLRRAC